jgi:hypothetical protein
MRYMLTGDHWGAEEAYRMGVIQEIAPNPAKALEAGIGPAHKIAACGPLGIRTTLGSAHLSIDESEAAAFARLDEQFGGVFHAEGRKAEAEGRPRLPRQAGLLSARARARVSWPRPAGHLTRDSSGAPAFCPAQVCAAALSAGCRRRARLRPANGTRSCADR